MNQLYQFKPSCIINYHESININNVLENIVVSKCYLDTNIVINNILRLYVQL